MKCKKCSQAINNSEMYTVCEGRCANRFHASCVGVDEHQWSALSNNVIWLCECCMDDFCKYRDRQEPAQQDTETKRSVDEEIDDLKTKVASILETIAAITVTRLPNEGNALFHHSTPVSSSSRRELKNSGNEHSPVDDCEQHTVKDVINNFDLLLTNIDPHVTESEISVMVSHRLGLNSSDNIIVKKLVAKGKDCSELDYVSFKVVLNENLKSLAMNARTWPKKVKIREFINRHNDTWNPNDI